MLVLPLATKAQTDVSLEPELGGRLSVSIDKKLTRGMHLTLEEEVRMDNNFGNFDRLQSTLSLRYKVHPNIKLGIGYALINPYSNSNNTFKNTRHRFMFDVTGTLHLGLWNLSLKERLQPTYRTGDMNEYQNPRTSITLKSRVKLLYTGFRRLEPYAYVELRNTLNAPVINAMYNSTTGQYLTEEGTVSGEAGWFLDSFTGCYINRLRGCLGAEYRIDQRSRIGAYLLLDYVSDKVVDANAEGTKLKSYTRERGFIGQLCFNYQYSF